jgi:predicted GNAT family acetyltransferase
MNRVVDNEARSRFELGLDGGGIAFIDYYRIGDVRVLTHAEVPLALRGRGIGARLTAATLELMRERGARVVPRCPYIALFMRRHPEYDDLLAPDSTPRALR